MPDPVEADTTARMAALKPDPIQKAPKLFPAWRVMRGITHAADEELEAAAESCDRWSLGSGGLLMFGLVIELASVITNLPHPGVLTGIANVFVLAGVGGEIQFGRLGSRRLSEITKRSKERLKDTIGVAAEVTERAAAQKLETERLKILSAWRIADVDTVNALGDVLKKMPPACVRIEHVLGDMESQYFAGQLATVFWNNGWHTAIRASSFADVVPFWLRIRLAVPPERTAVAKAVRQAFCEAGIKYGPGEPPPPSAYVDFGDDLAEPIVEIFVGPKRTL